MKNYLKSSIALGLLFFTFPTLAMEDQPDERQLTKGLKPPVTNVLKQMIKSLKPELPDELLSHVIVANFLRDEDLPNADYSNAFYSYDFRRSCTHLKSVKSACLNIRATCHEWRDAIDSLFKLIPTSQVVSAGKGVLYTSQMESPEKNVLYPSLLSMVTLDLDPLTPEAFEEQCCYLSKSNFKNLVFFHIVQSRPGPAVPRRLLTEQDMNALSSLLLSHAEDVKYLHLNALAFSADNAKIFAPVLPQLKNLEYLRVNLFYATPEAYTHLTHQFSSLKSLKNIFWQSADDGRECTVMASILPELPNLERFFIKGRIKESVDLEKFFCNYHDGLHEFPSFVTDETQKKLTDAIQEHHNKRIQEHPNKKLLVWNIAS